MFEIASWLPSPICSWCKDKLYLINFRLSFSDKQKKNQFFSSYLWWFYSVWKYPSTEMRTKDSIFKYSHYLKSTLQLRRKPQPKPSIDLSHPVVAGHPPMEIFNEQWRWLVHRRKKEDNLLTKQMKSQIPVCRFWRS